MKPHEVHKMKDEELAVELKRLGRKLFDLRSQLVTEKVEDVSVFQKTRRDIARLKTERRERVLRASQEQATA